MIRAWLGEGCGRGEAGLERAEKEKRLEDGEGHGPDVLLWW